MLLITYTEWSEGPNFITTGKKFRDHNGQRKVVFGCFKIQEYVQVHKRLISVCTQPWKGTYPETQKPISGKSSL